MKKEKEIKNLDNQQKAKIPLVTTEAQLIMSTAENATLTKNTSNGGLYV